MRLVKLGYGSWREVCELDASVVIPALDYEKFLSDYEAAYYMELRK